MDTETASKEILDVRRRLEELDQRRGELAADDFAGKADLLDEEHDLRARLGQLQSEFVFEETRQEPPNDLKTIVPPVV